MRRPETVNLLLVSIPISIRPSCLYHNTISVSVLFCLISISIGQDHMKYVVQHDTKVNIDGYIHNNTEFSGDFENEPRILTSDFLQFEHTHGLNYMHVQVSKEKQWLKGRFKYLTLKTNAGMNAGLLIPKSDVKLMHYPEHNKFHLAGYGAAVNVGIKAELFRHFYIQLGGGIIKRASSICRIY
ncbi:hypothetical protein EMGBS15_05950 [Filimonas sp.]|nr:hypothetical protein EMGBS15_05950 [Filimonas sp.]